MTLIRRRPVVVKPVATGEKKLRHVWNKGDPTKGLYTNQYWWVEATSREAAIAYVARQLRRKLDSFDGAVA